MVPGTVPEGKARVIVEEMLPLYIVAVSHPSHDGVEGWMTPMVPGFVPEGKARVDVVETLPLKIVVVTHAKYASEGVGRLSSPVLAADDVSGRKTPIVPGFDPEGAVRVVVIVASPPRMVVVTKRLAAVATTTIPESVPEGPLTVDVSGAVRAAEPV